MSKLTRDVLNSLLPKGSVWTPFTNSDLDKFLEGQADNYDQVLNRILDLSNIRNPELTPILEELEREYGISKNESLTEAQRRAFLNSYIFGSQGNGTPDDMEQRLQDAGFDVQVHTNDPAQDPQVILDQQFKMYAGGPNAYAGRPDAFARRVGGELIVNGDKYRQSPMYKSVAGGSSAYAGNASMFAGSFEETETLKIEYPVPTNPADWPLLWYVGGDATRDIDGKITSIEQILQPEELRNEFLKIILRYKPLHTWCISVVEFG